MRISYHEDTDSLYIHLKDTPTVESEEVAPGTVLHFDEDGNVTGIEIYSEASETVDLSTLEVPGLTDILDLDSDEMPKIVPYAYP
jgi:uncharacterized protein YuzE